MTDPVVADPVAADAALRLARLRRANPAAADLATLCSLAVRVEPELLRRLRLLLPRSDVSAEADLWASDIVSGASVRGISLDPRVADLLRSELAGARWDGVRERAWSCIAASHVEPQWHWSLRLEEQVYRLAVMGGPHGVRQAEDLLLAALWELARTSASGSSTATQQQVGISRWLLGALARLPAATGATDAAAAARMGAGLHLDRRAPTPEQEAARAEDVWLPWLLDQSGASPVRVRVAFTPGKCQLNARTRETVTIDVPATDPLVLDVQWHDGRSVRSQRVRFGPDEPVTLDVPTDRVELSTLAGDTWRLARAGAGPNPGGFDFSEERARHRPPVGHAEIVNSLLTEALPSGIAIVSGPAGTGTSVCATAVADLLERRGWVVAQHFFFVQEAWDNPELVATSLAGQLRAAVPHARWTDRGDNPDPVNTVLAAIGTAAEALPPGRGVAVLLDGPAGIGPDEPGESGHFVLELLRKSTYRPGVTWIVATRHGQELAKMVDSRAAHVDLGRQDQLPVCRALLGYFAPGLRVAFGVTPDASGPVPHEDELVPLSGTNPGRLRGIIDWLLDQRPGWGRLDEIPAPLTVRGDEALRDLERRFSTENVARWLGPIAVALDGFTLGDALRLADSERAERVISDLIDAGAKMRLLEVSELPFENLLSSVGPRPGLADLVRERLGPAALVAGHRTHVAALRRRTGPATPYQVASAIDHALAAHDLDEAVHICTSGAYLDRRAQEAGVATVIDDLWRAGAGEKVAEVLRAAETVRDAAGPRPERFVELLLVELRRRGAELDLVEELSRDVWVPPLQLGRVEAVLRPGTQWRRGIPCTAATRLDDGRLAVVSDAELVLVTPGGEIEMVALDRPATLVATVGADVVVAGQTRIAVLTHGTALAVTLDVAGPVTALAGVGTAVAAGTAAGTITLARWSGSWQRRVLVGHGGEVLVLAEAGGLLLSGSVDGQVRVWDPDTGQCLRAYLRHRTPVRHIAALSNGLVASGDVEGRILCWDPATGATVRTLRGHDAAVTALFEHQPGVMVSAGADGAVRRWTVGREGGVAWSKGAESAAPNGSDDEIVVEGQPSIVLAAPGTSGGIVTWDKGFNLRWWSSDGLAAGISRPAGVREPVHRLFVDRTGQVMLVHAGGVVAEYAPTSPGDDDQSWPRALAIGGDVASVGTREGLVRVSYDSPGIAPVPRSQQASLRSTLRDVSLALEEAGVFEPDGPTRGTTAVPGDPTALLMWDTLDGQGVAALEHWGVCSLSLAPRSVTLSPGPSDPTAVAAARIPKRDLTAAEVHEAMTHAYLEEGEESAPLWAARVGVRGQSMEEVLAAAEAAGRLQDLVAAALRDRPGAPALHALAEPWLLIGDRQGQVTIFRGFTPALRVTASTITAMAGLGGWAVIGTDEGEVLRCDPLAGSVTPLGRHEAAVRGVAAVGGRLAVTAGDDALLRVWDVEKAVEQGVVAGQAPFRAVASRSGSGIVAARHGDSELWFLEVDPSRVPPSPATDVDLFHEVVPVWDVQAEADVVEVSVTLLPKVDMEVRGAQLVASGGAAPVDGLEFRLDDSLRFANALDATGRLLVPHRIAAATPVTTRARQRLQPTTDLEPSQMCLRLTFVTPWSPVERSCEIGGPGDQVRLRVDGREVGAAQRPSYKQRTRTEA